MWKMARWVVGGGGLNAGTGFVGDSAGGTRHNGMEKGRKEEHK